MAGTGTPCLCLLFLTLCVSLCPLVCVCAYASAPASSLLACVQENTEKATFVMAASEAGKPVSDLPKPFLRKSPAVPSVAAGRV